MHAQSHLTQRQLRVVELVAEGLTNREIAQQIGTSEYVVKNYLRAIYDRLGFSNRVELALWYVARQIEANRDAQAKAQKIAS